MRESLSVLEPIGEMEGNSENDSISSTASSVRCREDSIFLEEQSLLQLLQGGILETTQENIAFTKEISLLLSKLNLEPQSLPNDIKEGLQKIALILRFEKLSCVDGVSLSIVSERKKIEEKKKQREAIQLTTQYDNLFKKYVIFSKKLNHLQEAVTSLENFVEDTQKDQDIYCNRISLSMKLKEYQQTVDKLKADITYMELEDIYPQKILNKYNKYLETLGEVAELNQYLSQYGDLPPNLLQAKALLENKKKEYEMIEKTFLEKTSYS
ncbi:uncharacterized protein LOC143186129 [Calliopsis andreniformis]|uniref:uncharacterized protein LOC143186129 n=1 Tax=Calliopsis andreniformis TaxID=337506 RepID=UPI003FCC9CF3